MFELVKRQDPISRSDTDWGLYIVRENFDGSMRDVAVFRDSEERLARSTVEFLNENALIELA